MAEDLLHIPLRDGRVDLATARVRRGGQAFRLSETELGLLRYLVQAEGRVVRRAELQVEVWGASPNARTRAMDSAMSRLRAKLEADPQAPRHLVSVYGEGYRFVPLQESRRSTSALPPERDAFIGRDAELTALSETFGRGVRLVSLVGIGGGGKTRLALRFARLRADTGESHVALAELDRALDEEGVLVRVGRALSVPPRQLGQPQAVLDALANAPALLLVLDNLEQVLEPAAALIRAWLDAAPSLRVLTTSRAPLRLAGEHVLPLSPLPESDAARLLVERARALRPDFGLEEGGVQRVQALVHALDGLPLAIELAAARARTFTAEGLLQHLNARFRLLADRRSGRPSRHATLWRALTWSWALLCEAERVALMQCSVFRGGFTAEAFDAALALPPHLPETWSLDLLDGLVEASLVKPQSADGRFRALVSVANFAAERLADPTALVGSSGPDAKVATERRHADWFGAQAERLAPTYDRQTAKMDLLDADRDNLHAALERACVWRDGARAAPLALGLIRLIQVRGPLPDAEKRIAAVLDLPGVPAQTQQHLHVHLSFVDLNLGAPERAHARSSVAHDLAKASGDAMAIARSALMLAQLARNLGRAERALVHTQEAMAAAESLDQPALQADILTSLSDALQKLGRLSEAEAPLRRAFDLRSGANPRRLGDILHNLSVLASLQGRLGEAIQLLQEACARNRDDRVDRATAFSQIILVGYLIHQGRLGEAEAILEEAERLVTSVGARSLRCMATQVRASLERLTGQERSAERRLRDALRSEQTQDGTLHGSVHLGVLLYDLLLEAGRFDEAEAVALAITPPEPIKRVFLAREVRSLKAIVAARRGAPWAEPALQALDEELAAYDNLYRGRFLARVALLRAAQGDKLRAQQARDRLEAVIETLGAEGLLRQSWRRAGGAPDVTPESSDGLES